MQIASLAPDFPTGVARLFDEKNGAFQVMGTTLGAAKGNGVLLNIRLRCDGAQPVSPCGA
jgi:hypothetical protein